MSQVQCSCKIKQLLHPLHPRPCTHHHLILLLHRHPQTTPQFNFFLELLQLPSNFEVQSLLVVVFGHQGQEGIIAHQLLVLHPQEKVHVLLEVVVASMG